MKKRALLAIAFAGGLLNQLLPALSENETKPSNLVSDAEPNSGSNKQSIPTNSTPIAESKSSDSLIEQIANNTQLLPEIRAFYLLSIAHRFLNGESLDTVQYESVFHQTSKNCFFFRRPETWENELRSFADLVSEEHSTIQANNQKVLAKSNTNHNTNSNSNSNSNSNVQSSPAERLTNANAAIEKALLTLNQPSPNSVFARLNLYFIASRLCHKTGNNAGTQKCDKIIDRAFRSAEKDSTVDESQTKAAASILNSMSNGIVPVHISDFALNAYPGAPKPQVSVPVTEKDFQTCQKLKLRAIAMVDRLGFSSHVRRKAHRDLVLWYTQLGKEQLAEREKQVLYGLVGIDDDSILYPTAQGCGRVVWWVRKDAHGYTYGCGMG